VPALPAPAKPAASATDIGAAVQCIALQLQSREGCEALAGQLCQVAEHKPGWLLLRTLGGVLNVALNHGAKVHAPPPAPTPPTPTAPEAANPAAARGEGLTQALSKKGGRVPPASKPAAAAPAVNGTAEGDRGAHREH
jgi:hypothetical protein